MLRPDYFEKLDLALQYINRGILQVRHAQVHEGLRYLHAGRLAVKEVKEQIEVEHAAGTGTRTESQLNNTR